MLIWEGGPFFYHAYTNYNPHCIAVVAMNQENNTWDLYDQRGATKIYYMGDFVGQFNTLIDAQVFANVHFKDNDEDQLS